MVTSLNVFGVPAGPERAGGVRPHEKYHVVLLSTIYTSERVMAITSCCDWLTDCSPLDEGAVSIGEVHKIACCAVPEAAQAGHQREEYLSGGDGVAERVVRVDSR